MVTFILGHNMLSLYQASSKYLKCLFRDRKKRFWNYLIYLLTYLPLRWQTLCQSQQWGECKMDHMQLDLWTTRGRQSANLVQGDQPSCARQWRKRRRLEPEEEGDKKVNMTTKQQLIIQVTWPWHLNSDQMLIRIKALTVTDLYQGH